MRGLFLLIILLVSIGGVSILLASVFYAVRGTFRYVTDRRSLQRGSWTTYTDTEHESVVVGIERETGACNLPERQEMYRMTLNSLAENPDLLYSRAAEADETAAALNMRDR